MFPIQGKKKQIEYITEKLTTDDRWLYRGLIAIYNRQTMDEQYTGETKILNGVGFNALDSNILSSFARIVVEVGSLSNGQKGLARKLMPKYSRQLWEIAQENNGGR